MFHVHAYPTLLYFPVTDLDDQDTVGYYDYNGERTIEALEAVILKDGWKNGKHRHFPKQKGPQQKWKKMYGKQFGSLI